MKKKDIATFFCTVCYIAFLFFGLHFYFGSDEKEACVVHKEALYDQEEKMMHQRLFTLLSSDSIGYVNFCHDKADEIYITIK